MKRRIVFLAIVVLSVCLAAGAQEKPQMMLIFEDVVVPAELDHYVEGSKKFFEKMVEADPDAEWRASMTDDLHVLYAMPIENFADLDEMYGMMEKMIASVGQEKFVQWMEESGKTFRYTDAYVVLQRDDLSYHPETMVPREEVKVLEFNFYHLRPGQDHAAEQLAKDYVAAMTDKGIESGFTLFQLIFGPEMPGIAVVVPARSRDELEAATRTFEEKMGEEGEALMKRSLAITREFDRKVAFVRPDLSSTAFKKEKE